jgi:opacity protein-like surface antigen
MTNSLLKNISLLSVLLSIIYFSQINQSQAGNGYYLGADYMKNSIEINTANTFGGLSSLEEKKIDSKDYGFRAGYRHKIHKYGFIAPEFAYQKIDSSGYLYSTTMKAGVEIKNLSLFGSLGYSEIEAFNNSSENFGGGFEYKINDNFSFNAEYIKFGDVKTSDILSNTQTDKINKLQTMKFGITYYFHE